MRGKTLANLVSRATAFAVGAMFAAVSVRWVLAVRRIAAETALPSDANASGVAYLLVFAALAALPAIVLIGFAVLPTGALYKIDPSPTTLSDADDLVGTIGPGL